MKKFFQLLGFVALFIFSFYYTEKTVSVVKEFDDIMIEIKAHAEKNRIKSENALVTEDTIVPGRNGQEVDVTKSYQKMREYGKYDEKLLLMEEFKPKISIEKTYHKYVVGGNTKKRQVSLLFLLREKENVEDFITLADKYQVKFNFFIESNWLEKNNEMLLELVERGHIIGNLSLDRDVSDPNYPWVDTVIKRIAKQKKGYCYVKKKNKDILDICSANQNYTILPSVIVLEHPYKTIKEKATSGSIIAMEVNQEVLEELPSIIKYLESKNYTISNLETHLSEENDTF